jgi:NAD(P)-dependent dehydrogenase (short-subunit alcohol dehydrogenase family)
MRRGRCLGLSFGGVWSLLKVGRHLPLDRGGRYANKPPALAKHDIVKPGGSLTLTSGAAAIRPRKGAAIGSALNGGLITTTQALADELAEKKIRVNTVVPGLVITPLWDKQGHSKEKQKEIFEEGAKELSVGFVATPEHIAEAYLYAVRADYANGTTIVIDGGPL